MPYRAALHIVTIALLIMLALSGCAGVPAVDSAANATADPARTAAVSAQRPTSPRSELSAVPFGSAADGAAERGSASIDGATGAAGSGGANGAGRGVAGAAAALPASCRELSLQRRAALVLVVGMPEVIEPDDPLVRELTDLGVGGVFITGYNVRSRRQVRSLTAALDAADSPAPLIATDEEWGRVSSFRDLFGSTSSPRTLAATRTPTQVRAAAAQLGRSLADLGVDWNFAPVADLDGGPASGVIGDRAFAQAPGDAGRYAGAFADGMRDAGIRATAKHFPGHGAVVRAVDPHRRTVPSITTLSQLRRRHLPPFERLIADDVPVVMLNHVTYKRIDRDRPASMSPRAYQLLRDTGFDGVAITDSVGMGAVHRRWGFPGAAEHAILAGADAVLATDGRHARRMRNRLVEAVRSGRLSEARLNEAVGRVLALHGRDRPCT